MPQLGETVTEGTITRWMKAVGEHGDAGTSRSSRCRPTRSTPRCPRRPPACCPRSWCPRARRWRSGARLAVIGDGVAGEGRRPAPRLGHRDRSPRHRPRPGRTDAPASPLPPVGVPAEAAPPPAPPPVAAPPDLATQAGPRRPALRRRRRPTPRRSGHRPTRATLRRGGRGCADLHHARSGRAAGATPAGGIHGPDAGRPPAGSRRRRGGFRRPPPPLAGRPPAAGRQRHRSCRGDRNGCRRSHHPGGRARRGRRPVGSPTAPSVPTSPPNRPRGRTGATAGAVPPTPSPGPPPAGPSPPSRWRPRPPSRSPTDRADPTHRARAGGVGPACPGTSTPAPVPQPRRPPPTPVAPRGTTAQTARLATLRPSVGDRVVPFSNMRRRTAEHMVRSKATSPHAFIANEVDFENVERVRKAWGERFRAEEGFSLTYLPFVARATVEALRDFPNLNASVADDAWSCTSRSTWASPSTSTTRG